MSAAGAATEEHVDRNRLGVTMDNQLSSEFYEFRLQITQCLFNVGIFIFEAEVF